MWKLVGAFGVRLQEHQQKVTQCDVRAYTRSTKKSAATEQNKSAVTDHAISLNHVIEWDHAKVIDRESSRMDRWIRESINIRKEQDKSMKRDEGSYQLPHICDYLLSLQRHLVDGHFDESSSSCRDVNKNNYIEFEQFFTTY